MAENSLIPITSALISVSDKTGLVDFVRALICYSVSIISTGGTAKALQADGQPITSSTGLSRSAEGGWFKFHHGCILEPGLGLESRPRCPPPLKGSAHGQGNAVE